MKLSLKVEYACQVLAQLGHRIQSVELPHIDDLANAVLAFDDARSAYGVRRGRRTSNVVLGVLGVVSGVVGFWKKFPPAK